MLEMFGEMTIALAERNRNLRNSKTDSEELAKYVKGDSITIKIVPDGTSRIKVQYACKGTDKPYEVFYNVQAPSGKLSATEYAACRVANSFFAHKKALSILELVTKANNNIKVSIEDVYAEKTKAILSKARATEGFKDVNKQELEMLINLI